MEEFRIVDLREPSKGAERRAFDKTPEGAASGALEMNLVRSGSPSRLVCKVYWKSGTKTNVVRLYEAAS